MGLLYTPVVDVLRNWLTLGFNIYFQKSVHCDGRIGRYSHIWYSYTHEQCLVERKSQTYGVLFIEQQINCDWRTKIS